MRELRFLLRGLMVVGNGKNIERVFHTLKHFPHTNLSVKTALHHGYLTRRTTRYIPKSQSASGGPEAEQEDDTLEESDGETQTLLPRTQDREYKGNTEKVEVEYHIVYSRTYHVPQLMIRAWNEDGAPLSLTKLLSTSIIHPNSQLPLSNTPRDDAIMLDPHSPFPLIQQSEHPTTGEVVWSIHPCQVALAVEEILTGEGDVRDSEEDMSNGNGIGNGDGDRDGDGDGDGHGRRGSKGSRWLECWLMLSGGVVDLRVG